MSHSAYRITTMGINGKIAHAVLQVQRRYERDDGTWGVRWEDVRELRVTPDGKFILSRDQGESEVNDGNQ